MNGAFLSDFNIVVADNDIYSYGSPAGVLRDYCKKYCNIDMKILLDKETSEDTKKHSIFIGKSAKGTEELADFSRKIFVRDGNIYILGGNVSDCEQAVIDIEGAYFTA